MAIVVTGTSGQLGRQIVEKLLERGVPAGDVVATARDTARIADLAERGVRTARLDYTDVQAEGSALSAGDVLVLVSSSEVGQRTAQHRNVVEAAVAAGVARVVYTSTANIDTDLVVAPEHRETEALIEASGLPRTFLRNGWYTENYAPAFAQAQATGAIAAAAADGRVASVERAELAEAAAVVASTEGHEQKAYELVAPTAWTHAELAATFGEVLGREVTYAALDADAYREVLLGAGLDEGTAGFLVTADLNIADGDLAGTGDDLAALLGRAPRTLRETVGTWA
ncbi:NmrA family NAD(P)-binding protein [Nocardioides zeae]|uniref:NmrA family NAD(P)-binding protein n=1 Tax=Nocardioides imazamoxiresistens TaxID=3231893 RepID=A0ABU3PVQ7_9ACTN|nr:NmrA family NAD(P)-binding protein [Nocardioides zeae]MDT9592902.1 NmrA family NAD(P)-binding protein [Nocardioides zeae]